MESAFMEDRVRDDLSAKVEALLLAAEEPLSVRRIAKVAGLAADREAVEILNALNAAYDADGSGFRIAMTGGGVQMLTHPDAADWLDAWREPQAAAPLGNKGLQVLSAVAYRQPLTRADVEAMLGAPVAETLKRLVEEGWIKVVGQEESLGRPKLYGVTRQFLHEFALSDLGELPKLEEVALRNAELVDPAESDEPTTA
jgi:segregation and condensation protein B